MSLLPAFEWLESSKLGVFMKDLPATFAVVEAVHLIALAVLGGAVLTSDLRLLNVVMRDTPSSVVTEGAHKWFKTALVVMAVTGFFQLAGVATKCYHNPFFWTKMTALAIGVVFVFGIRQPLLKRDHAQLQPVTLKMLALASMSLWLIVAASGRWIGFS